VSVIGDLNGQVGLEPDYIPDDALDKQLLDNISFINYNQIHHNHIYGKKNHFCLAAYI
jgi:hypothetical protein